MRGHLRHRATAGELAECLDGLPWALLKGAVLAEHAHPVPGIRSYADLDVLVAPSALRAAIGRLTGAGWMLRDDAASLAELPGELHLTSPRGQLLDLHWSLVRTAEQRAAFPIDTEALLRDVVPVPLGPSGSSGPEGPWPRRLVPSLGGADLLVHVCLHAALAGADRLLLLLDADQVVRNLAPDWDEVLSRAGRARADVALAAVLAPARRLLGTPVPAEVAAHLRRRSPLAWRAGHRLLAPAGSGGTLPAWPDRSGIAPGRALTGSVRPSSVATLRVLAAHARVRLAGRGARPGGDPVEPAGERLASYLRAVEACSPRSRSSA